MREIYIHKKGSIDGNRFTMCAVKDGCDLLLGISLCSGKEKNFIKATGRKIAFARAQYKPFKRYPEFFKDKVEEDWRQAAATQLFINGEKCQELRRTTLARIIEDHYHQTGISEAFKEDK